MRPLSLRLAAFVGVALAAACSTTPAISNTNNIVRATDVELICLEVTATAVVPHPTSRCTLSDTDNGPGDANPSFHIHAVVPQFDRGELAVIDLASTSGVALIDNSPGTPGYSFVPVGEFPVAIAADIVEGGGYVYVASSNIQSVLRVDAAALRSDPSRAAFASHRVQVPIGGFARDLALVVSGDRHLLVATLPEAHALSVTDVTDAAAPGAPMLLPLRGGAGGGDAGAADGGTAAQPHPVALAVDTDGSRLYVTDDAITQVHVIDVATLAELDPLAVGERTRVATVTGNARARRYNCDQTLDPDHCTRTRYLYLTTADEGAVIVWDLTRGARVRPNLLPLPNARNSRIEPSVAADRVALLTPATALVAINTNTYDAMAADLTPAAAPDTASCSAGYTPSGVGVFSGVFVGVLQRNGLFSVIDVDDYNVDAWEASCAAGAGSTVNGAYRFVRHAPHPLTILDVAPALSAPPTITATLRGTTRGQTLDGANAPTLVCGDVARTRDATPVCSDANGYGVALPKRQIGTDSSGNPTYGPPDPFTSRNELWTFNFEGVIPGLDQTGGAFTTDASGAVVLQAPGGLFCTRGTLAVDGQARDVVTIVTDPTPLAGDAADCLRIFGNVAAPFNRDLVIDHAFEDHLQFRGADAASLLRCFPQSFQYQVRTGGQWIGLGSRTGFVHSVRVGASGECEIDPAKQADTLSLVERCARDRGVTTMEIPNVLAKVCPAGRACTGTVEVTGPTAGTATRANAPVFANPYVCFQIFPALQLNATMPTVVEAAPVDRDTQISFTLVNAWDAYRATTGSLPVATRFLPGVDRVFVVDAAANGLMEFRFDTFAQGRIFN